MRARRSGADSASGMLLRRGEPGAGPAGIPVPLPLPPSPRESVVFPHPLFPSLAAAIAVQRSRGIPSRSPCTSVAQIFPFPRPTPPRPCPFFSPTPRPSRQCRGRGAAGVRCRLPRLCRAGSRSQEGTQPFLFIPSSSPLVFH